MNIFLKIKNYGTSTIATPNDLIGIEANENYIREYSRYLNTFSSLNENNFIDSNEFLEYISSLKSFPFVNRIYTAINLAKEGNCNLENISIPTFTKKQTSYHYRMFGVILEFLKNKSIYIESLNIKIPFILFYDEVVDANGIKTLILTPFIKNVKINNSNMVIKYFNYKLFF